MDFNIDNYVWVLMKPWRTDRPSKKLDFQMDSPYKILEKVGSSFRINLPASFQVHPIIPPDRLQKAAMDPVPGQRQEPPPPIMVNGEKEYKVEEILAVRLHRQKLQYHAK
jgi:hypothetical protein